MSLNLAILVASAVLLVNSPTLPALQIADKRTTPLRVGALRRPVVLSNLALAGFHGRTLVTR